MSTLIRVDFPATGRTDLYAVIERVLTGQVWNGAGWETRVVANWGTYALPLTETPSGSCSYQTTMPAGITLAGTYRLHLYLQLGADPAPTDARVSAEDRVWDGAAWVEEAAAVWLNRKRSLTQSAAAVTAAVSGSTVGVLRGDTLEAEFTDLGDLSSRTKLWLTVKRRPSSDADAQAVVQVTEAAGATYLNAAAAPTPTDGAISVTDAGNGDLTLTLKAALTAALPIGAYRYDFQVLTPTGVSTLAEGVFSVHADVTRAVS